MPNRENRNTSKTYQKHANHSPQMWIKDDLQQEGFGQLTNNSKKKKNLIKSSGQKSKQLKKKRK